MTRPLRVLMVNDTLDVGGSQRVTVSLAEGLARRGHQVTVMAEPGGELWDELPVEVERVDAPVRRTPLERLRYFRVLSGMVRSGEFDLVHAHQRAIALQARVARAGTGVRVVEHVHSLFRADRRLIALVSFRGDRLVACGRGPAEMLVREFGRSPERITTVPNGVRDLSGGAPTPPPASTGGMPTIAVIGRATDIKDPRRFIDVIEQLNAGRQRAEAVWVGDGDMLAECREEVRRRGVAGLTFVGGRPMSARTWNGPTSLCSPRARRGFRCRCWRPPRWGGRWPRPIWAAAATSCATGSPGCCSTRAAHRRR